MQVPLDVTQPQPLHVLAISQNRTYLSSQTVPQWYTLWAVSLSCKVREPQHRFIYRTPPPRLSLCSMYSMSVHCGTLRQCRRTWFHTNSGTRIWWGACTRHSSSATCALNRQHVEAPGTPVPHHQSQPRHKCQGSGSLNTPCRPMTTANTAPVTTATITTAAADTPTTTTAASPEPLQHKCCSGVGPRRSTGPRHARGAQPRNLLH